MKASLNEDDNRVACNSTAYSLRICLEPESNAEAMKLGILSQTLRSLKIWCIIHPETGKLEIRAARRVDA